PDHSPCARVSVRSAVNHQPESRMRETRLSGSEGGGAESNRLSLPLSAHSPSSNPTASVALRSFVPPCLLFTVASAGLRCLQSEPERHPRRRSPEIEVRQFEIREAVIVSVPGKRAEVPQVRSDPDVVGEE